MSKHTPGPWIVEAIGATELEVAHEETLLTICKMPWVGSHYSGKPVEANARLIAAAPELLAVLKELEECAGYWSEYDVPLGIVDRIRAAIARVEAV